MGKGPKRQKVEKVSRQNQGSRTIWVSTPKILVSIPKYTKFEQNTLVSIPRNLVPIPRNLVPIPKYKKFDQNTLVSIPQNLVSIPEYNLFEQNTLGIDTKFMGIDTHIQQQILTSFSKGWGFNPKLKCDTQTQIFSTINTQ